MQEMGDLNLLDSFKYNVAPLHVCVLQATAVKDLGHAHGHNNITISLL